MKMIVRPRGGLRVRDVTRVELSRFLTVVAQIPAIDSRKDVICLNAQLTIVVVSASKRENADPYTAVERTDVRGTTHEVSTYEEPPHGPVKCGTRYPVGKHTSINPRARFPRIQPDGAAGQPHWQDPVDGDCLPRKEGGSLHQVRQPTDGKYVAQKLMEVCYACGRLGHRMDVGPDPANMICRGWGTPGPRAAHTSDPKCSLCGGNYLTAAKASKAKFKTPTSFVDAGARRSIPFKETMTVEKPETREVLQADPTVAVRHGAKEVRRRRIGAATATIRAAPGRNLGYGAAQCWRQLLLGDGWQSDFEGEEGCETARCRKWTVRDQGTDPETSEETMATRWGWLAGFPGPVSPTPKYPTSSPQ
ncbi:hypothetical protein HPB48_019412 [Haemaphysalis longicornis]|uniref:Uncharacterized protein n=1 Tax=Haemaphysalis longicornis TaxID=44386 RepID=A0A9J6GJG3_HAELO|nr:hypothetical protein HPB48_019412 [Haemaphysalis longicornis]